MRAMDYVTTSSGEAKRVHKEYVDVVARFGRDGDLEPVVVCWKDGRSFAIDEVTEMGRFGSMQRGRQCACYRIRFGGHETRLFLERQQSKPAIGEPEQLRWWVYAYDSTMRGART